MADQMTERQLSDLAHSCIERVARVLEGICAVVPQAAGFTSTVIAVQADLETLRAVYFPPIPDEVPLPAPAPAPEPAPAPAPEPMPPAA